MHARDLLAGGCAQALAARNSRAESTRIKGSIDGGMEMLAAKVNGARDRPRVVVHRLFRKLPPRCAEIHSVRRFPSPHVTSRFIAIVIN